MSYMLRHLKTAWEVDQAIIAEEKKLVVVRFGTDWDSKCMAMDEMLAKIEYDISNFAIIYVVDITQVPDFNQMYELYDSCTLMFFYRGRHQMIDLGTGNHNKVNWVLENKQELVDIIETIYRGAIKGKRLVIATKDYSTKHKY